MLFFVVPAAQIPLIHLRILCCSVYIMYEGNTSSKEENLISYDVQSNKRKVDLN